MSDPTTLEEIQIYFFINEIGHVIWLMEKADSRIPENARIDAELTSMRKTQVQAITSLHRFGVQKPFQDKEKPSGEYWAWFRWWDRYIKGLSKEEWDILNKKLKVKEDVSKYRPQGDWRLNIAEEEKNLREAEDFWDRMTMKNLNLEES